MNKIQLEGEIIKLATQDNVSRTDMLTLDSCLEATRHELSDEGLEIINKCIERVRDRIHGFTENEIDWFNKLK